MLVFLVMAFAANAQEDHNELDFEEKDARSIMVESNTQKQTIPFQPYRGTYLSLKYKIYQGGQLVQSGGIDT